MDKKKAVFFGELLMRLGTKRYERFIQARDFEVGYTGAEANAAVSASNYGIDSYVVSAVPETEIGQACINYIRQYGINTEYVLRRGKRLGTFYLETGASQRPSKVIYDRAESAITELQPGDINWDNIFRDKDWFHFSGTAPALADNLAEVTKEACIMAKKHDVIISCDLNFRRKLWTPERANVVMTGLMNYIDVLIGNEEDSDKVFGIKAQGVDVTAGAVKVEAYRDVARQLYEKFNLRYVGTTLRESISASDNNWSCILYDGKDMYQSEKYKIHIVDRVGGGDSFSGALIYGLLSGHPLQEAVNFAAAASCLKHSIHGDLNLVSLAEVSILNAGDASGRVQR